MEGALDVEQSRTTLTCYTNIPICIIILILSFLKRNPNIGIYDVSSVLLILSFCIQLSHMSRVQCLSPRESCKPHRVRSESQSYKVRGCAGKSRAKLVVNLHCVA